MNHIPIPNTLKRCDPHRVEMLNLWNGGEVGQEIQRASFDACMREAMDHGLRFFCRNGHRYRITNTEPDHYRLDVEEDTAEGRYIATVARILPPWTTPA